MIPDDLEGWGWPSNARQPHYFEFRGSREAVCGYWLFGPLETQTRAASSADCAACVQWVNKRASA